MTAWLLELIGRGYRNERGAESARRALEKKYPELEATDVWLRARETDRDVVAVLFRRREGRAISRGVPAYKLFGVRRDLGAEEIRLEEASTYSVRGVR